MYTKFKNLLASNWRRQSVVIITFACLLLNALTLTLYYKNEQINDSKNWVIHSYEVLKQSRLVLIYLQDMELGQRGYFLSSREEFLEPYENAKKNITAEVAKLEDLVSDSRSQTAKVSEIMAGIKQHEELLNEQNRKFKSKRYVITIRDLNQSSNLLETIRQKIEAFQNEEKDLLAQRQAEERRKRNNYVRTIIFGSLLAVIGLVIANGLIIYQSARRRKIESDLKRSEEIYTLVTQGINEGVFEYDIENNTVYYSKGYKQMLGYKEDEFPNTIDAANAHTHPEDYKSAVEAFNQFVNGKTGGRYQNIFRLRHKDGYYIWVLVRGIGIYGKKGKLQKLVGTHTDITEQKENEEYLKQLNAELENFTYVTSHDLRSPLVNLKGFSAEMQYSLGELAKAIKGALGKIDKKKAEAINQALDTDLPEALRYISNAVERLDQLTGAILDLSRIGRRGLKIEKINVTEMVKKSLDTMAYEINKKNVRVKIGELPEVNSDRVSLQQIFANILENAVKYLDEKRNGVINVKGAVFPGEVQYMISDNGRGISDTDKDKVFDMFKRARNVSEVRGVGMGMSFVKATVQRLGGRIWFESTLGEGTKFIFTIPNRTRRDAYHEH